MAKLKVLIAMLQECQEVADESFNLAVCQMETYLTLIGLLIDSGLESFFNLPLGNGWPFLICQGQ